MAKRDVAAEIRAIARERILVLDGAWGTLIHGADLGTEDYRGARFADHPIDVTRDPDILNLTRPDFIADAHARYLAAGADITTTNTFTATSIGQADYALEPFVHEMNVAGARIAREVAGDRFVAGSVGPLNVTLSLSPKVDDPSYRTHTFDQIKEAYAEQMLALAEGGVDLLMLETIFDTLNAKAAITAARENVPDLPLWISSTIVDRSGRMLSGQTIEAFWTSVEHADPLIVGVNCSLGAHEMRPYVAELAHVAPCLVSVHPNAGLPNAFGGYDETPEVTSSLLREFAEAGFLNVAGSCCGSGPDHTAAIAAAMRGLPPRTPPPVRHTTHWSGLETFEIGPDTGFVLIGERTNVTGSARFRRLVEADDWVGAVEVALEQVRGGANALDVNMDADLLESVEAIRTFLDVIATEPEVARIPVMVDSSRWSVIEAGLQSIQGKGIVNSISLKEGEEPFLEQARRIRDYGASVVVMAFDEEGQATDVDRRVAICGRAYDLLTAEGFPPEDLIFDPNVLAVATGIEEHETYARDFLEALPRIKERCPGSRTSGGISNLSFSFRGNDALREAMHAVFLYHAIRAGLDMGIVNAGPARGLRGRGARAARADRGRDLRAPARRHRSSRRDRRARQGRRRQARARPRLARGAGRGTPVARTRPRDRRLHRGGHRGGAPDARPAARRDRGAADGRDADRRRPVRVGPDVPAPGRQVGTRDEARGRLPRALHGGGESRRFEPGQGAAGHRQGRRPRHRQEHRRRRARLQQLRDRRPRRDGAGRADPRYGRGAGRRHHRALRA